ncbi:4-alpha-glucanotransferase [soil metagenome]
MSIRRRESRDALRHLAERFAIAPSYRSMRGETIRVPDETMFAALRVLGAEISTFSEIDEVYERKRAEEWALGCNPTAIAWDGEAEVELRLPSRHSTTDANLTLKLEDGGEQHAVVNVRDFKITGSARIERTSSILARSIKLPWTIPPGYHQLEVASDDVFSSVFLISAPLKAFQHAQPRTWGTFLPLYSLTSENDWGAGNVGDLGRLMQWTAERGGSYAGTLPLLPAFLSESFLPGPYSPVSRLFWNEFYIDVTAIPEFAASEEARRLVESADFQREVEQLRSVELVDYRHGMKLRRSVLELLVATLIGSGERYAEFRSWLDDHIDAHLYAAFRALCERHQSGPSGWPEPLRPEDLDRADYDEAAYNYHAYVQWIASQQFADLPRMPQDDVGLYLDLPIGVHRDGYDVWREPNAFATGFSVGAPPDLLGADGQNWGFPPLHPANLREQGYRHFIDVVRHHMRHASLLRVDHIMGLHRQFWIPEGGEAKDGAYVHYPADDLYAILCLESHRNQSELIGEDLGTVPESVRPAMEQHGISRMIIVPFEVGEDSTTLDDIPAQALAALNTHDMPPLAGVWESWFGPERQATLVTLLKEEGRITDENEDDLTAIIAATLEHLGASDARTVLVNLEDLWLETRSQNIPGTSDDEHANWRRKASRTFEEFSASDTVIDTLARLDSARRRTDTEDRET